MFLRSARVRKAIADVRSILHLPRFQRLLHSKARRPIGVVAAGVAVMVAGSIVAASKEAISAISGLHHILVDAVGYFIHAAGAVPVLKYIEPLWLALFGTAEAVAEAVETEL